MDNALYYLAINRQSALAAEMDVIANNIANLDTSGFRREGLAFTEHVLAAETGESVSMADAGARFADTRPGELAMTGGQFDIAIEGEGYFVLDDAEGPVLTRAGAFQISPEGFLTSPLGAQVLDIGQAPIFVPPDAENVLVAADGTISADGLPIAQLAVVDAAPQGLSRLGDTVFRAEQFAPVAETRVRQGALERSNVDPVAELARMIEVSRAYETAQSLIEDEDDRIQSAIRTLSQNV